MKLRTHYTSTDSNASIFGVLVYKHTTGCTSHSTCAGALIFSCKRNAATKVTSTLLHVTIEHFVWNFTPLCNRGIGMLVYLISTRDFLKSITAFSTANVATMYSRMSSIWWSITTSGSDSLVTRLYEHVMIMSCTVASSVASVNITAMCAPNTCIGCSV